MAERSTRRVESSGASLWVETYGTGPPVVWIHGGAGNMDHRSWLPWIMPLAKSYTLVVYDRRGHGRSSNADPDTCRLDVFVEDLEVLRQALQLDRPVLVGHSAGGYIALLHALQYPDAAGALAVIGATATHQSTNGAREIVANRGIFAMLRAFDMLWGTEINEDGVLRNAWETLLPIYFADPEKIPPIPSDMAFSIRVRQAFMRDVSMFDVTRRLTEIRMPVLVCVGAQDWICPVEGAEHLHHSLPRSTLAVFRRSGHFPFIEERQDFLETVERFLMEHHLRREV